ncbi:MAG: hypothetical protein RLZZ312_119 [Bacteroidota bacterium]|jgi:O-antigen/teichoic acid export membrane protein
MKNFILKKIQNHASLFVIVLGAILFFLTNIILKQNLSSAEYGSYSIFVTFFFMCFIYGPLGFEQVLLRHSFSVSKNIISLQKSQIYIVACLLVFSSVCFFKLITISYKGVFGNDFLLLLSVFCMSSLTILYSIFRLNEDYIIAQVVLNGYKIILFVIVCIMTIYSNTDLVALKDYLLYVPIIVFFAAAFMFTQKIKLTFNQSVSTKKLLSSHLYFFISLSSFTLINFCDRFLIEKKLGEIQVGDYFFLSNVFLAPFAIMQNYIGFKKLAAYKNKFNIKIYQTNNKQIGFIVIFISLCLLVVAFFSDAVGILNFKFLINLKLILLLLLMAITRMFSLTVGVAFDLLINVVYLRNANMFFLGFTIMLLSLLLYIPCNIEIIVATLWIIWLSRLVVMHCLLMIHLKSTPNVK